MTTLVEFLLGSDLSSFIAEERIEEALYRSQPWSVVFKSVHINELQTRTKSDRP
jgi:hypothetical protein